MAETSTKLFISEGKAILGIELGSTRIKAILIGEDQQPISSGSYLWENRLIGDNWSYDLDDVWIGIQACYKDLYENVYQQYNVELKKLAGLGISAMMHGYLVFDRSDRLLTPFRTWRNNNTLEASEKLMCVFEHPIPQRWSIAHLYQSILDNQEHVPNIDFMTTLSGYVHWKLTGCKVLGIGDASGMFPIDIDETAFDSELMMRFDHLVKDEVLPWKFDQIIPEVLTAGQDAGFLTEAGTLLLDPNGQLQSGCPMCPPEGDAGTGMIATNTVSIGTGNISAGTSIFAMVVLDEKLKKVHSELDLVTTPDGKLVAMVHSNNCSSNLDAWMQLFREVAHGLGSNVSQDELYETLFKTSLKGDDDCAGLMVYGYLSGEHLTHFEKGCPLFLNPSDSKFTLANFMRANLLSAFGAMKIGIDILVEEEGVNLEKILAHGGLFKTKGVVQHLMATALNVQVATVENASEGGAWGIALLSSFLIDEEVNLDSFLKRKVFLADDEFIVGPEKKELEGVQKFMRRYKDCLPVEREAINCLT